MTAVTAIQLGQEPSKRPRRSKGASKHGCTTCRIRRVKCDEGRPACLRCTSTGRHCDGYRSNFVNTVIPSPRPLPTFSLVLEPNPKIVAPKSISNLSRYFTLVPAVPTPDGAHDYYVLEASATLDLAGPEAAIQHALTCLDTLRTHHEKYGDPTRSYHVVARPEFQLGLEEYSEAIRALSGRMSESSTLGKQKLPAALRTALLCSQLFISIEVALNDIHAASKHFICGLQLMHQYGTRPYTIDNGAEEPGGIGIVVPTMAGTIPDISIFVIKVYLSCPQQLFCFPDEDDTKSYAVDDLRSKEEALLQTRKHVAHIAKSTVAFLQSVQRLCSSSDPSSLADELVLQRQDLLHRLDSARYSVESFHELYGPDFDRKGSKRMALTAAFMNLFYLCLKVSAFLALQGPGKCPGGWEEHAHEMVSVAGVVTRLMGK